MATAFTVGRLNLQHRMAIAPVTQFRAGDNYALLPIMAEDYTQSVLVPGTLLATEEIYTSAEASGYANAPALYCGRRVETN